MGATREKCNARAVVALAGNPNTGKSTIFNALTGLRQHTGNWPGKTVTRAQGIYSHVDKNYLLVDLPGTYSLLANSADEQVARDFLCFAGPDATIVVVDATCLERNLNLVLQVMEITGRVAVCVNLIDEARKKAIDVDTEMLAVELGVPVVPTVARSGRGLDRLKEVVAGLVEGSIETKPRRIKYEPDLERIICQIESELKEIVPENINSRWLALRLADGDRSIMDGFRKYLSMGGVPV